MKHKFHQKLLLNQWLISLFGIDPLVESAQKAQPFHLLKDLFKGQRLEGLDHDNLHRFYHDLVNSNLFLSDQCTFNNEQVLRYEENIVRHTRTISEKRERAIVWKYYQWLTLLFVEIYLDRFFGNREKLLNDLNEFVKRFNNRWSDYDDVPPCNEDDLNKICLQNATGSGKTLLMHVNLLQYRYHAARHNRTRELSRVILLTPNERLSDQHIAEFKESNIAAGSYLQSRGDLLGRAQGLGNVDVLEITKLADQEGPNTISTRSLGDQNLLLVDEGHRGMSGKQEGIWFTRRSDLCSKGFTFEYSATFEQAVKASNDPNFQNSYAKAVLFDYSYRWFYEDGFGKDYQILNLPASFEETRALYMTACLLKFYQQLRIYENDTKGFDLFNLEKPLWIFVGSTVSANRMGRTEKIMASDVALIIQFIADFLNNQQSTMRRMEEILTGTGQDTGLLDKDGTDIFASAFTYLNQAMNDGETVEDIFRDILKRLFNNAAGGTLSLNRIKNESGEVALRVGQSDIPFGLINVGDARNFCDHIVGIATQNGTQLTVTESGFTEKMFASSKDSTSPVNLLIGSKKFVEGWDCWRVSTMGLMHVGRSEGAQIIQLFGRGVRLKGYNWSLKRSGHTYTPDRPPFIEELETLNVFGIEADFMEKFREYLKREGLPGNERRRTITIPLNVTYDFGKKLKVLRPRRKASDGTEYDFRKDGAIPTLSENVPDYILDNKVIADWYPRIAIVHSHLETKTIQKDQVSLCEQHLALLDYDMLFFELEQLKHDRHWYNFNITRSGIKQLLKNPNWYTLYLPKARLNLSTFDDVLLLQQVASGLLKRYCAHYYNYRKREYIEPRLELRDLTRHDDNIPREDSYQFILDGDEKQVIQAIQRIKECLEEKKPDLPQTGPLNVCCFDRHLFQPLFRIRPGEKITVRSVVLNESEYQFVTDLKAWCDNHNTALKRNEVELFLLRNMSRGKGVGFFEADSFHPDFILWVLTGGKQYVTFIEPHGLTHEGPGSKKILFFRQIKNVEQRLKDPEIILNSFILSWTPYPQLKWGKNQQELEDMHLLFMKDQPSRYIDKMIEKLGISV